MGFGLLFQLALRGSKRLLGAAPFRKLPITPKLLLSMARLFNLGNPLHAAMWALFLVAFFSFLRKSNLVVDSPSATSDKLPRRCDFVLAPEGAFLQIRATKTIQFKQRILSIPLPFIPNSPLCPVSALINHFRLNRLASSDFFCFLLNLPLPCPRVPSLTVTSPPFYLRLSLRSLAFTHLPLLRLGLGVGVLLSM